MYLKEVKKEFKGSFKDVSSMFQENLKKKVSRVCQECVNEVLLCNFVEWMSSQLPKQKEGLFS